MGEGGGGGEEGCTIKMEIVDTCMYFNVNCIFQNIYIIMHVVHYVNL